MERMLTEALDAGFVGMSSMQLLFDKLDGDVCRSRTLPSTYAKPRELRRLKSLLRKAGRVLQSGPGHRESAEPGVAGRPVARHLPQSAQDQPAVGRRRQVQPVRGPDDGPDGAARQPPRRRLPLAAPARAVRGVRRRHRPGDLRGVRIGCGGTAPARRGRAQRADARRGLPPPVPQGLREQVRRAGLAPRLLRRRHRRLPGRRRWSASRSARSASSAAACIPVDAFLDLVLEHGTALRWRTTISNHRPEVLKKLARDPGIQMGFSDAGAHLRNMAFYNMGLRLLRHVRDAETGGHAVHDASSRPCTASPANSPTGTASTPGTCASVTAPTSSIIDPARLDDSLDDYAENPVDQYGGLSRMVNRNDETVTRGVRRRPHGVPRRRGHRPGRQPTHRAASCAPPTSAPRSPRQKDELSSVS